MQTKQTAKKSTSGVAKRKILVPPTRVLRLHTPLSRQPSRLPQPDTNAHMEEGVPTNSNEPPVAVAEPAQVASQGITTSNSGGDEVSRLSSLAKKFDLLMDIPVVPPLL